MLNAVRAWFAVSCLAVLAGCATLEGMVIGPLTYLNDNNVEGMKTYLALGGDPDAATDIGSSLLGTAVAISTPEMVRVILDAGAHVGQPAGGSWGDQTPLDVAIASNRLEIAEVLIAGGAELMAPKADGSCPLSALLQQIKEPQARVARLQKELARGPGVVLQPCVAGVMHAAITAKDTALVIALIDAGFPQERHNTLGSGTWAPLPLALMQDDGEMMRLLAAHGASTVGAINTSGQVLPYLHFTAATARNSALKALIDLKAADLDETVDIKSPIFGGKPATALAMALANRNEAGIRLLEQAGAQLDPEGSGLTREGLEQAANAERARRALAAEKKRIEDEYAAQIAAERQRVQNEIYAQQQAEQDEEDRRDHEAAEQRLNDSIMNFGKNVAQGLAETQAQQDEALRGIERAGAAGRAQYEERQQREREATARITRERDEKLARLASNQRLTDESAQRAAAERERADRAAAERDSAQRAAADRAAADRAAQNVAAAAASRPLAPSAAAPAANPGPAATRSDPRTCVTPPETSSFRCGDLTGLKAKIVNNCPQMVEARICFMTDRGWDCQRNNQVGGGSSWEPGECRATGQVFHAVGNADSRQPLASP